MLTKKALERAQKLDRAYGGDGNCSHQFGGPEPGREPAGARMQDSDSSKSGDHIRRWDEEKGCYIYIPVP